MKLQSLQDLLVEQLKDLFSAENQLIKALPKMIKNANSDELRSAFEEHLEQTRGQVERLDQIFDQLDAIATFQGNIHHHHIRSQSAHGLKRFGRILRLATNHHISFEVDHLSQATA